MKNKKRASKVAIVLACILIPVGAFGFGYFYSNNSGKKSVSHTLTVDGDIIGVVGENVEDVECDVNGIVPGDSVNVPISINPKSSADSLLRVKVTPYWMSKDGNENSLSNNNLELVEKNITSNMDKDGWFEEGEYYYFTNKVNKNINEIKLIEAIKFLPSSNANEYQNMNVGIRVRMEMVQCKYGAYENKWGKIENESLKQKLNSLCGITSK